jgi:SAM-dependent methyltransferase
MTRPWGEQPADLYDRIGRTYTGTRRPDPRIATAIWSALGDAETVLNVGAGAGAYEPPDREVVALEPSEVMIAQRPPGSAPVVQGRAEELPFADGAFDAVCELGVLHHVADPQAIVAEMTRVARRAVFLSDVNRFAGGRTLHRAAKYALFRLGLWPATYRLATRGRGYHLTQGDGGVVYSYSVYDSLPLLSEWADRVFLVPTVPARAGWFHPLFGAHNVLLCALRD